VDQRRLYARLSKGAAGVPSTALKGIFRSFDVYYRDTAHLGALTARYRELAGPGDLAFDIGSHVGDRVSVLRRLGARVVALEPQPLAHRALRLLYGRDPGVTLLQAASGETDGEIELLLNTANPTVSTASREFTRAADGAAGWEGQTWDTALTVPCVCLDTLVQRHGTPRFIKIDVEGYEPHVLRGLSRPVPVLSFEFTLIQIALAEACIDRLSALGFDRFNFSLGESHQWAFDEPVGAQRLVDRLMALPVEANSGDVYAWHPEGAALHEPSGEGA